MVKKAEGVIIIFLQKKSPYSLSIFGFKWHQQKVVCPVWDEKKIINRDRDTQKKYCVHVQLTASASVSFHLPHSAMKSGRDEKEREMKRAAPKKH